MSVYYFDIHDGSRSSTDIEGCELSERASVEAEAVRILPAVVLHERQDAGDRDLHVRVRDEQGDYVFQATLTLRSGWIGRSPKQS